MDPSSNCLHEEVIQFAVRFQEWALINKELAESLDPAELNLNSAILQARLNGLTPFEKRQVLKVSDTIQLQMWAYWTLQNASWAPEKKGWGGGVGWEPFSSVFFFSYF